MKSKLFSLFTLLVAMSCVPDKIEENISSADEQLTVNSRLNIPPGFSFESTQETISNIQLDESFTTQNVKIQIFQVDPVNEEQMIYDGFINKNKALTESFKIPNHIEGIKIVALWNGIEKKISTSKTALSALLSMSDFAGSINSSQFSKQNDYTFCEDGGANGTVEIYERVLVIKGSNKKDEVDVDKNGSKTKVEPEN